MHRHTIDPLSAVLGLLAVAGGVIVAGGRADPLAGNAVWWIAIVALLLGVALVPWPRSTHGRTAEPPRHVPPGDGPITGASTGGGSITPT